MQQREVVDLTETALPAAPAPQGSPAAADSECAEEFISFGDVDLSPSKQSLQEQPAEEDDLASPGGSLPWAKSSSRIRAPLLRLHNGT